MRSCAHGGHPGGAGNKIVLKSDGEFAMQSLKAAVGKYHGGIIIPEVSARGESQSNGAAEQAAQVVAEFVRVLKVQIEHKVGNKVETNRHYFSVDDQVGSHTLFQVHGWHRRKNSIRTEKRETMPNASCPIW